MPKIDHKLHGQYNFLNIGVLSGKTVSITAVLYDVGNFKHLI